MSTQPGPYGGEFHAEPFRARGQHQQEASRQAAYLNAPDGRLACTFKPAPAGQIQLVDRIVVQGPAGSQALVYVGDVSDPGNIVDGTNSGQLDVNDCNQSIPVQSGQALSIVWQTPTGGVATGQGIARITYREVTL